MVTVNVQAFEARCHKFPKNTDVYESLGRVNATLVKRSRFNVSTSRTAGERNACNSNLQNFAIKSPHS